MRYSQQTVLAVAVLASTALAAPIKSRDVFDDINAEYDRTIGARDVFDEINAEYDRTIGARDIFDEINTEYDRTIGARDIFDEINSEYDRTIGAREAEAESTDAEFWHEVGTFSRRDVDDEEEDDDSLTRRDIFDDINTEYDRTIGARDIFDEINTEYDRTIGAREAEPETTDAEFWHEVGTFSRRDVEDDEEVELDSRGLFSHKSSSSGTSKTDRLNGLANGASAIGSLVSSVTGIFDGIKNIFNPPQAPPAV